MSRPRLYSFDESGNSYKVRLLAALLNLDLEIIEVDFINKQQRTPEFLAINPRGEVPVLVDGDRTLADSSSILSWLAGKYTDGGKPGPSTYWSSDLGEQADIIDWLAFANSWVQYGVFTARGILSFGGSFNGVGTGSADGALKEATVRSYKSLEILDTGLSGKEWLANGRPTIADLSVFVYVALAPMGDIDLSPYKNVLAWIERVKGLPGFIPIKGLDDPLYRRRSGN